MTQEFQSIGGVSPALDQVAAERQGWGPNSIAAPGLPAHGSAGSDSTDPPEDLGYEFTDADDFSFRDRRANTQKLAFAQGLGTELNPPQPMAAHIEIPMAARQVVPPAARNGPQDGLDASYGPSQPAGPPSPGGYA